MGGDPLHCHVGQVPETVRRDEVGSADGVDRARASPVSGNRALPGQSVHGSHRPVGYGLVETSVVLHQSVEATSLHGQSPLRAPADRVALGLAVADGSGTPHRAGAGDGERLGPEQQVGAGARASPAGCGTLRAGQSPPVLSCPPSDDGAVSLRAAHGWSHRQSDSVAEAPDRVAGPVTGRASASPGRSLERHAVERLGEDRLRREDRQCGDVLVPGHGGYGEALADAVGGLVVAHGDHHWLARSRNVIAARNATIWTSAAICIMAGVLSGLGLARVGFWKHAERRDGGLRARASPESSTCARCRVLCQTCAAVQAAVTSASVAASPARVSRFLGASVVSSESSSAFSVPSARLIAARMPWETRCIARP